MNRRTLVLVPVTLAATVLFGASSCDSAPSNPNVQSDSSQRYATGSTVPVDTNVYRITGEVSGQVNSLTRQVKPAHGSSSGSIFGSGGSIYGSSSGSYFGPVEAGKGFVRLLIQSSSPATAEASPGQLAILKVTDTKATALLPGDVATFKCRRQYEAVAAVQNHQKFDVSRDGTWELDYCRLASPEVTVKTGAQQ